MYIYSKEKSVCITTNNIPVESPEYEIELVGDILYVNGIALPEVKVEKLTEDKIVETAVEVKEAIAINLGGKTISCPEDTTGDGVYHVVPGGALTINGEGVINSVGKNDYSMAIWADGGRVEINGGAFTNVGAKEFASEIDGEHFDLIYVKNGGYVEINGGYFECETPKWTLNNHDTKPGTIIVKGGTFKGYNPAESHTEPGNRPVCFVAEGYKVIQEGDLFKVVRA
jgi:hypothetical protein